MTSYTGILHHISTFTAFEATPSKLEHNNIGPKNTLLWLGGLFDIYASVTYPYKLSQRLAPNWSLVQLCLTSSGTSWGTSDLDDDIEEIHDAVNYFHKLNPAGKVILMGHSTGCQGAIHYNSNHSKNYTKLDGIILQAGVSDREAFHDAIGEQSLIFLHIIDDLAKEYVQKGNELDCLPGSTTIPIFKALGFPNLAITAQRWLSLSSPDKNGQDDYFSSDLSDEQLRKSFGSLPRGSHLLIIYGQQDEYVPKTVDKTALIHRWIGFAESAGVKVHPSSKELLEDASHNLNNDSQKVVDELCNRVLKFLQLVVEQDTIDR